MTQTKVNGYSVSYEVVGDQGRPWVITPGRFSMTSPGVRELAIALAERGNRVLIWDRPNCGASDVQFSGPSESAMQADVLAGLLRQLDLRPAVIAGGSGGSRLSLLTAARHRDVAAGLALWWISGGVYGLMSLGLHYCGGSLKAVWNGGMEAVAALPEWQEVLEANPRNRALFLAQDPKEFLATMERWMAAYCPCGDELVPGLPDTTPEPPRSRSPRCCRTPGWSSHPGKQRVERTVGRAAWRCGRGPVRRLAEAGPGAAGLGRGSTRPALKPARRSRSTDQVAGLR
jgi:pimeloyl-ACP methyl ester carboxylesterase